MLRSLARTARLLMGTHHPGDKPMLYPDGRRRRSGGSLSAGTKNRRVITPYGLDRRIILMPVLSL